VTDAAATPVRQTSVQLTRRWTGDSGALARRCSRFLFSDHWSEVLRVTLALEAFHDRRLFRRLNADSPNFLSRWKTIRAATSSALGHRSPIDV